MIVLENVYVEQMIVNGFLHFCIFKTNSIFLKKKKNTQGHDSNRQICPKV